MEEPNEYAFNYSIWIVFIMNRGGNVKTVDVEILAHDVYAMYDKFAEYFKY